MQFSWDSYTKADSFPYGESEAHTARGWLKLLDHPDLKGLYGRYVESSGYHTVGNYLEYASDGGSHGPDGETIHAVAYYQSYSRGNINHVNLGFAWFITVQEAKDWIMAKVAAHCGQPMLIA